MPTLAVCYPIYSPGGALTLLVDFDANGKQLLPVGVGRIKQRKVISEGKLHITHLDYLCYVIKSASAQNMIQRYLNNDITFGVMVTEINGLDQ